MAGTSTGLRILLLTPQLPYPPQQGTSLRNYHLLRYLAGRHRVSLLSFATPDTRPEHVEHLRALCAAVEVLPVPQRNVAGRLRTLLTSTRPDMAWRLHSAAFANVLQDWLGREPWDVVQAEGIEMAPYLELAAGQLRRAATPPQPLLVFDDHNAEYLLQRRAFLTDIRRPARLVAAAYSLVQWRRLRSYERRVALLADHLVAVSAADAQAIDALDPRLRTTVVPNGVDLDAYQPDGAPLPGMAQPSLVFTGKMDYRPNVDAVLWFAGEVLPRLWSEQPDARFYVVGQAPSPRLDVLRGEPRIVLTGKVDDVRPYIAGATVYVAPLRVGGGTRLKILEAMAMGKALVATPLGAEGLDVTHGREAMLVDDPAGMAQQILALLGDEPRRRALGAAARAFVERGFGWEAIGPRLEATYQR